MSCFKITFLVPSRSRKASALYRAIHYFLFMIPTRILFWFHWS